MTRNFTCENMTSKYLMFSFSMFNWCHRYTYTSVKTRQIFAVLLSLFFEVMVAFD